MKIFKIIRIIMASPFIAVGMLLGLIAKFLYGDGYVEGVTWIVTKVGRIIHKLLKHPGEF